MPAQKKIRQGPAFDAEERSSRCELFKTRAASACPLFFSDAGSLPTFLCTTQKWASARHPRKKVGKQRRPLFCFCGGPRICPPAPFRSVSSRFVSVRFVFVSPSFRFRFASFCSHTISLIGGTNSHRNQTDTSFLPTCSDCCEASAGTPHGLRPLTQHHRPPGKTYAAHFCSGAPHGRVSGHTVVCPLALRSTPDLPRGELSTRSWCEYGPSIRVGQQSAARARCARTLRAPCARAFKKKHGGRARNTEQKKRAGRDFGRNR